MIRTIIAIGLAALLVTAGAVAAAPGQAPTDSAADEHAQSSGHGQAGGPDDAGNQSADAGSQSANASNRSADAGPPTDMPAPVPNHVTQIHETINRWLSGSLTGTLGEAISSIVGGNQSTGPSSHANENATNTTAPAGGN